MSKLRLSMLGACIIALTAGCSSSNGLATGNASPTTSGTHADPTTQELPRNGAPAVSSPVDVSSFKQQPCRVLTDAQLQQAGIAATGKSESTAAGPSCDWDEGADGIDIAVTFLNNKNGLSDIYEQNKAGKFAGFRPVSDVNGFPAVQVKTSANEHKYGNCAYIVGVNNNDALDIVIQSDTHGDSCSDVRSVANGMTKTIKANAGGE